MKIILSLETEEVEDTCEVCCFYDACMQTTDLHHDFLDGCKDGNEGYWTLEHI